MRTGTTRFYKLSGIHQVPISTHGAYVFESITLRGVSSLSSIFCLIKDFFTNATTRARLSMAWIVFASIYLLFFQTLMSEKTGYSGESLNIVWHNIEV
jgi:hypothetical protein